MGFLARLLAAVLFFTLVVDVTAAEAATKPSAPRSVKATPGNQTAKVSWTAPSSNGGAAIDKYAVQRWTGTKWITVKTTSARARSWTNTGLTNGKKYYFRVTAHNRLGWGRVSAQASVTPRTVPTAPYKFQADLHPSGLGARWGTPTNNGGAAIDFYLVEVSTDGVTWTTPKKSTVVGTADNPVLFDGLVPGGRYYLRARAHNAAGYSAVTASGPYKVYVAPLAIRDPEFTSSSGQVALTWRAPLSDTETGLEEGLPAAASYQIETSVDGGPWSLPVVRTVPSYTATGLVNGSDYAFRVTAKGSSRIGLGAPTIIAPDAPTGVPTVPTNVGLNWRLPEAGYVLTWAPPVNDGGLDLVRYEAEHWNVGTPPPYDVTELGPDATSAPAPFAEGDTMHIRACNALGCSPWSADIGPVPGFVTNPTIEANDATVSIAWDPPANEVVAPVEDYSISRSSDDGETWSELGSTTETTYEDDTADFATAYKYRVIPHGADGSGGWTALDITTEVEQVLGVSDDVLDVPEGGSNTFDVTLTRPVDEATDIAVTSDSAAAEPSAPTVTVAADGTSATVTINGVDNILDGDGSATITVAYLGQTSTVDVTVLDDEVQAILGDETAVSVKDGNNTLVNVSLAFQPASNVTVQVASDLPGTASVSTSELTFTPSNWNNAQFFVITGVDPGTATVTLSATDVVSHQVAVTVGGPPVP